MARSTRIALGLVSIAVVAGIGVALWVLLPPRSETDMTDEIYAALKQSAAPLYLSQLNRESVDPNWTSACVITPYAETRRMVGTPKIVIDEFKRHLMDEGAWRIVFLAKDEIVSKVKLRRGLLHLKTYRDVGNVCIDRSQSPYLLALDESWTTAGYATITVQIGFGE